jgi:hypothetical protein
MKRRYWTRLGAIVLGVAVAAPLIAGQQFSEVVPTKKDPLRFTAFAVQMQGGRPVVIAITIERWTTDAERNALVALVQKTTDREADQRKLLKALQDIKVRAGFLNTPNSMGWDIKYAYESALPDGGRQIVIVTDKPVSFAMAASGQAYDAAFSLIEIQFPKGSSKGVGKALAQAGLSTKNGRLQIESYVNEPARLTEVTEENPKVKK